MLSNEILNEYSNILFSSTPSPHQSNVVKRQVEDANRGVNRYLHDEVVQNRFFIMTLGHSLKLICQLEWRIDYNSFQTSQGGKTQFVS